MTNASVHGVGGEGDEGIEGDEDVLPGKVPAGGSATGEGRGKLEFVAGEGIEGMPEGEGQVGEMEPGPRSVEGEGGALRFVPPERAGGEGSEGEGVGTTVPGMVEFKVEEDDVASEDEDEGLSARAHSPLPRKKRSKKVKK